MNGGKFHDLVLTLAQCLLFSGCSSGSGNVSIAPTGPFSAPQPAVTVDFTTTYQTIRGFGGSSAWISDFTSAEADTLFGTGAGQLGLTLLRVRIDPGGQANWGTELNNAQLAAARGASVIATPWTPPAAMKSNNNIVGGALNPASYAAYATYLESFVQYMQQGGVNLYAISMQNEPDAQVTYESCAWTPSQIDTWVAQDAGVLTTRLYMPESESFNTAYSDPTLSDPAAVGNVAIVAGHIYGVSPQPYPAASTAGKELWMTEHYLSTSGIAGALALAEEVHAGLTTAGYNAYLWWWIDAYPAGNYSYGLVDSNRNPTLNGDAMAQFSRFVRPGYQRVSVSSSGSPTILISAYAGNGHLAIVAINPLTNSVSQPFTLVGATVTSLTPWQTSATENIALLSAVTVSGGGFTATLPPQSITTFVQ